MTNHETRVVETLRRLSPHAICAACICNMLDWQDTGYIRDICNKAASREP